MAGSSTPMDALGAVGHATQIQKCLIALNVLNLAGDKYPPTAYIKGGDEFDFIVVGCGTSGSVIAGRLAEVDCFNVLCIEAGDFPTWSARMTKLMPYKVSNDWNYTAELHDEIYTCSEKQDIDLHLGKVVGGSSAASYMLYETGHQYNFGKLETFVNDTTWSWNNVKKYYIKSQRVESSRIKYSRDSNRFGYEGNIPLTVEENPIIQAYLGAFEELGYNIAPNLNGENPLNYAPQMYSVGKRGSVNVPAEYFKNVSDNKNLKILTKTLVTKIKFDADKKAEAVDILMENGTSITLKAKKEIIITSGAINTPKLLQLSGLGPAKLLSDLGIPAIVDLSAVGKNLRDQPTVVILHEIKKLTDAPNSVDPLAYPAPAFAGNVALNGSSKIPSCTTVSFVSVAQELMLYCAFINYRKHNICNALLSGSRSSQMLWTFVSKAEPISTGEVKIQSSDASHPPYVNMGYFAENKDHDDLVDCIINYMRVSNTTFFQSNDAVFKDPNLKDCIDFEANSAEYWSCYLTCMKTSLKQYSGTCALNSVVDSKTRVYGVKGLRVGDVSILPFNMGGHLLSTAVMIAEKVSDMIKEDHGIS